MRCDIGRLICGLFCGRIHVISVNSLIYNLLLAEKVRRRRQLGVTSDESSALQDCSVSTIEQSAVTADENSVAALSEPSLGEV
jgi:hypothetical protein